MHQTDDLTVTLAPLTEEDREAFIRENQAAFRYGAREEFGLLDDSADKDGEVISRAAIERCLDAPDREAYRILCGGRRVGGAVLRIDARTHRNELELLFVAPSEHNRGIGGGAWRALRRCIPKRRCGRSARRISMCATSISISTNAAFAR